MFDRLVPEAERIQNYIKSELGILAGCYDSCALCAQKDECAIGGWFELKRRLYNKMISIRNTARDSRRQSRYDRTRLRSFRKLRERDPVDRKDSKKYRRAYMAAGNIIRYWSQWAKYHIKRF
jgi:hypothetical protein